MRFDGVQSSGGGSVGWAPAALASGEVALDHRDEGRPVTGEEAVEVGGCNAGGQVAPHGDGDAV